ERNPRLKCRKCNQAKLADTPDPNRKMPAWRSEGADRDYSTAHPVYSGQLRIAHTPTIGTGELPHRLAQQLLMSLAYSRVCHLYVGAILMWLPHAMVGIGN